MNHRLPFGDEASSEAAILDIFQKYPPTTLMVSITLHEAGKGGGVHTVHQAWPPGSMSDADIAKFVSHRIAEMSRDRPGKLFDSVTLDFVAARSE
jgi:hypothetical protein